MILGALLSVIAVLLSVGVALLGEWLCLRALLRMMTR